MNCSHCDCANQPVLISVMVPVPLNDDADTVHWQYEHWCVQCIDDTREEQNP